MADEEAPIHTLFKMVGKALTQPPAQAADTTDVTAEKEAARRTYEEFNRKHAKPQSGPQAAAAPTQTAKFHLPPGAEALLSAAGGPSPPPPAASPSLADALREFATPTNALDAALKDFAAQSSSSPPPHPKPAAAPPPYSPTKPTLDPVAHMEATPTMDPNLTPQAHIKTAFTYIEQIEKELQEPGMVPMVLLPLVDDAARHLAKARELDPEATYSVEDTKGELVKLDQDFFASQVLNKEGRLCFMQARRMLLDPQKREAIQYFKRAKSAWEKANLYKLRAEFFIFIAETERNLGNYPASIVAANKALELEPANVRAIQFLDQARDMPKNAPTSFDLGIKKQWLLAGGGVLFLILGANVTAPLAPILAFSGVGMLIVAYWIFRA